MSDVWGLQGLTRRGVPGRPSETVINGNSHAHRCATITSLLNYYYLFFFFLVAEAPAAAGAAPASSPALVGLRGRKQGQPSAA